MVAPLSSSGGIERASASARMRSRPGAQIACVALADIAQHRNDETALGIDGDADVDALDQPALAGCGSCTRR